MHDERNRFPETGRGRVVHGAPFGKLRGRGVLSSFIAPETDGPPLVSADLQALLDAAPVAFLLVERADERIVFVNVATERLLACAPGALDGIRIDALLPHRPHGTGPGDVRVVRGDGTGTTMEVDARPVRIADRDLVLLTLADATARAHRDQDAVDHLDEIAHLSRVSMLGELSGALAHELNQPLAAILSNAQAAQRLLRMTPPDLTEIGDILADIVSDDRRAGDVIQRLRTWLRKEHVEHVPLGFNGVVLDALHLVRSDLRHRGVDVQLELAGELPRVAGDRVQLQQVLLNLVMNGCDAMEGMPAPRLLLVRTSAVGHRARAEVVDRGRGIAPGLLQAMFEPFETTKPDGLGMGLAVCRSIIESHGGRIWSANMPRGGACVAFELPEYTP